MNQGILRRTATALGVAALLTVAAPQAAHAGSNGQHIEIDSYGCWYSRLYGLNQNGTVTDTGVFYLPYYGANRVGGYWWKGTVHVYCYDQWGDYRGLVHTEVPTSQSGDWWAVSVEPTSTETDTSGLLANPLDVPQRQYNF